MEVRPLRNATARGVQPVYWPRRPFRPTLLCTNASYLVSATASSEMNRVLTLESMNQSCWDGSAEQQVLSNANTTAFNRQVQRSVRCSHPTRPWSTPSRPPPSH